MIKSVSTTSTFSITKWAYLKSTNKFVQGWDEEITNLDNADLLLTLVSDQNCPQRGLILKCLYFLVGTGASKHEEADIAKINILLDKAKSSSDQVILNWVSRSRMILGDLKKFDYNEWCRGGFSEKDLPEVHSSFVS